MKQGSAAKPCDGYKPLLGCARPAMRTILSSDSCTVSKYSMKIECYGRVLHGQRCQSNLHTPMCSG